MGERTHSTAEGPYALPHNQLVSKAAELHHDAQPTQFTRVAAGALWPLAMVMPGLRGYVKSVRRPLMMMRPLARVLPLRALPWELYGGFCVCRTFCPYAEAVCCAMLWRI